MSLEGLCVGWRWRRLDLSGNNCAWQGGTDHVDKIPREPRGAFIHGLHGDHEHRSTGTMQGRHGPQHGLGQFLPLGGDNERGSLGRFCVYLRGGDHPAVLDAFGLGEPSGFERQACCVVQSGVLWG